MVYYAFNNTDFTQGINVVLSVSLKRGLWGILGDDYV